MAKDSKRVKPAEPAVLKIENWQHADEYIKRIADLQLQITESQASAKGRIDKIKEALAADVALRYESINLYHRSIEAFVMEHLGDFQGKQSRQLNFGKLGWRKSTFITITKKTLDLIKQLFSKADAAIYIRTKQEVDKEALTKLTEEQLVCIEARRKIQEVFFVEPDLPEVVNYAK